MSKVTETRRRANVRAAALGYASLRDALIDRCPPGTRVESVIAQIDRGLLKTAAVLNVSRWLDVSPSYWTTDSPEQVARACLAGSGLPEAIAS